MSRQVYLQDTTSFLGKALARAFANSDHELVKEEKKRSLGQTIMQAEVVVVNLNQNNDHTTGIMNFLKEQELENEVLVIGISTCMTWAHTKKLPLREDDEGNKVPTPFTEANYKRRKSSVLYKPVKMMETLVINSAKENLATCVVAPGILYGAGESDFHHAIKTAWLCEEEALTVVGNGDNKIPTIHVQDLAQIILSMASNPPANQYVVAVDQSSHTQKEIIQAISSGVGTGKIVHIDPTDEQVVLNKLGNSEVLLADIFFEADYVVNADVEWKAQGGIAATIDQLRQEYILHRGLRPVRIWLHGPPGSGKSHWADRLGKKYYLPVVRVGEVIQEVMDRKDELTERVLKSMEEKENEEKAGGKGGRGRPGGRSVPKTRQKAPPKRRGKEAQHPRIPLPMLNELMKRKLRSAACRNKGYVLDGYPRTLEEARLLFCADKDPEEEEEEVDAEIDEEAEEKPLIKDKTTIVDFILSFDTPVQVAQQRFQELPAELVRENHNDEAGFKRRWANFQDINKETIDNIRAPLAFPHDVEVMEVPVKITEDENKFFDYSSLYIEKRGKAFNYHPTPEEEAWAQQVTEEKAKLAAEALAREQELKEKQEQEERKLEDEKNVVRRDNVLLEDQTLVEACALPLRKYLMSNVIPALVDGMLDVVRVQPDDPIDYLAEYLFQYSVGNESRVRQGGGVPVDPNTSQLPSDSA